MAPSYRVTTGLNVRAGPSRDSPIVGLLRLGETAELVERVPRWYRILLKHGREGYVSKSWAVVLPDNDAKQGLPPKREDELQINFFNIGAGTCTLIECPGKKARPIVVDCGKLSGSQDEHAISDSDLRNRIRAIVGNQSLDLVLSHGDKDHYSLISMILEGITVDSIWQGDDPLSYDDRFRDWVERQVQQGATWHKEFEENWHNEGNAIGNELDCGGASAYVLTVNSGNTSNSRSLILMLEYEDFTAIFTGDATGVTEKAAIRNFGGNLQATLLTGSHHGASTKGSNGREWVLATSPDIVIYSAGTKFGHPRCKVTARLGKTLASTQPHNAICGESNTEYRSYIARKAEYMTRANGLITVTTNGKSPLLVHCEVGPGCQVLIPF